MWRSVYFTISTGADKETGITYYDCIQVEEGNTVNDYNMLENRDFSASTSWTKYSYVGSNEGIVNGGFKFIGDATKDKNAYQVVKINKPASQCTFLVSGYANGTSVYLPSGGSR